MNKMTPPALVGDFRTSNKGIAMRSILFACCWVVVSSMGAFVTGCKPPTPAGTAGGSSVAAGSTGTNAAAAPAAPTGPLAPVKPPFALARPALPPPEHGTLDFSKLQVSQLVSMARVASGQDNAPLAAALQRYAVEKGSPELFDLACYESRARNLDAAIYWLQEAALREGVDAAQCDTNASLEKLRADPRWAQVQPFLTQCQTHWSQSGIDDHQLVLPANHQGAPLPVLIWLHGENDCATSYAFPELQSLADRLQVAFVSASGPVIGGPRKFSWSADMQANDARITAALGKFADKLKVKEGQVALAGFSQGGVVAGELAARDPARYSGALIMSPAGFEIVPANVPTAEAHQRLNVVVVYGTGEGMGVEQLAGGYAERFRSAGATVTYSPYTEASAHALVPDFKERLPEWTARLLGVQAAMP